MSKRKRCDPEFTIPSLIHPTEVYRNKDQNESSVSGEVPNFIVKLVSMLADSSFTPYITWNDAGTSIIIHDVIGFQKIVLPRFFNHSNFASFTRQLNM